MVGLAQSPTSVYFASGNKQTVLLPRCSHFYRGHVAIKSPSGPGFCDDINMAPTAEPIDDEALFDDRVDWRDSCDHI